MGFLNSLFNSAQNAMMSQFGINRPRDAERVLENIIHSRRDEEEKVKHAKPILMWLKKKSLSADRYAPEAKYVLDQVRDRYRFFLEENCISI